MWRWNVSWVVMTAVDCRTTIQRSFRPSEEPVHIRQPAGPGPLTCSSPMKMRGSASLAVAACSAGSVKARWSACTAQQAAGETQAFSRSSQAYVVTNTMHSVAHFGP